MQLACNSLGGKVDNSPKREFGGRQCFFTGQDPFLKDVPNEATVWMSHEDQVQSVSEEFQALGHTDSCPVAAVKHRSLPVYGIQFHPEVTHTPIGNTLLRNFLYGICKCDGSWNLGDFAQLAIDEIAQTGRG